MKAIAIDGPSGVGKSTVSKEIARALNFLHVDTGALYRAVALHALRSGIPVSLIVSKLENIKISLKFNKFDQKVFFNDKDVTQFLRSEKVSNLASKISKIKEVRKFLLETQRNIALNNNVVMDGRDIGTVVLPNADIKIFLTAKPQIRAKRRFLEMKQKGNEVVTYEQVLNDIIKRDRTDTERKISPLHPATSAVILDVSDTEVNQVVKNIISICKAII